MLENPYERELAAVDATPAGAVVVLATGGCLDVAVWGELLTTRMLARGGVGVVTDGGIRDVAGIRRLGVPSFAAAITPRDSFGRALVTGCGEPVTCAGVAVAPGDLVRGDEDGVVVVPRRARGRGARGRRGEARPRADRGGGARARRDRGRALRPLRRPLSGAVGEWRTLRLDWGRPAAGRLPRSAAGRSSGASGARRPTASAADFCDPDCERLFVEYWLPRYGGARAKG